MSTTNHCLLLKHLPDPPRNKTGWPWTEQSQLLPNRMPDGSEWPLISIVTPSYNQGEFLEETIRSVLLQGYPNLEYIIMDGGSNDESVAIIQKYEPFLSDWVSQPDKGQTHAINQGLQKVTGEIFAWLNSDDFYTPNVLLQIATAFRQQPFGLCYGKCEFIDAKGNFLYDWPYVPSLDVSRVIADNLVPQPSCFLNAQMIQSSGLLNEQLQYAFDYEYWVRFLLNGANVESIPVVFSKYRLHDQSKTQTSRLKFDHEMDCIHQEIMQKQPNSLVKRAIAQCYRRFSEEHYYWYNDRERSMAYFHKMLQIDPSACNIPALKVYIKNLLHRKHYAES
jgi:glycosyltransferase involved in cell wall biosynthesis